MTLDLYTGDLVEYRSVDGFLQEMRIDYVAPDGKYIRGQGRELSKARVTRVIQRADGTQP